MKENEGFAKLRGYDVEYFIQKLSVTLGRTQPLKSRKDVSEDDSKAAKFKALLLDQEVDIPLGAFKNISRLHARITYNFAAKAFELLILSKNGGKVGGEFYDNKSGPIRLKNGAEVQLGDSFFIFQLPSNGDIGQKSPAAKYLQQQQQLASKKANTTSNSSKQPKVTQSMDKPNVSYATMIAQALSSTPSRTLSLQQIYQWISDTYPYYTQAEIGWKSSVRHNLSHSKFFHKVPQEETESHQRGIYTLNGEFADDLLMGITGRQLKNKLKEKDKPSNTPNTPATPGAIKIERSPVDTFADQVLGTNTQQQLIAQMNAPSTPSTPSSAPSSPNSSKKKTSKKSNKRTANEALPDSSTEPAAKKAKQSTNQLQQQHHIINNIFLQQPQGAFNMLLNPAPQPDPNNNQK